MTDLTLQELIKDVGLTVPPKKKSKPVLIKILMDYEKSKFKETVSPLPDIKTQLGEVNDKIKSYAKEINEAHNEFQTLNSDFEQQEDVD